MLTIGMDYGGGKPRKPALLAPLNRVDSDENFDLTRDICFQEW